MGPSARATQRGRPRPPLLIPTVPCLVPQATATKPARYLTIIPRPPPPGSVFPSLAEGGTTRSRPRKYTSLHPANEVDQRSAKTAQMVMRTVLRTGPRVVPLGLVMVVVAGQAGERCQYGTARRRTWRPGDAPSLGPEGDGRRWGTRRRFLRRRRKQLSSTTLRSKIVLWMRTLCE